MLAAAMKDDLETMKLLVEHPLGCIQNVRLVEFSSDCAFHYMLKSGGMNVVKYLLDKVPLPSWHMGVLLDSRSTEKVMYACEKYDIQVTAFHAEISS